jgi:hypothetical protein
MPAHQEGNPMICFEVSLNGEMLCTAGVLDGSLHASLWRFTDRGIRLHVDGTESCDVSDVAPKLREAFRHRRLEWIARQMKLGDEITVRIVDRPECDPPKVDLNPNVPNPDGPSDSNRPA